MTRRTLLLLLTGVGCNSGTEVGRASFTGEGKQEIVVNMPSAGRVHFDAAGAFDRPSNRNPIKKQSTLSQVMASRRSTKGPGVAQATCKPKC